MSKKSWLTKWLHSVSSSPMPVSNKPRRRQRSRLGLEPLEDRVLLATFLVNSVADPGNGVCDAGECTLREAIAAANATPGVVDQINFAVPGACPQTIKPLTPLPSITDAVLIDGYTQLGAMVNTVTNVTGGTNAVLCIELAGDAPGGTATRGLTINSGGSTVRGLVVNRFIANGIELVGGTSGNSSIVGNFMGTDPSGTAALPNGVGLSLQQASNGNIIGGTAPADRNLISGNKSQGVEIGTANNAVRGNLIGTDRTAKAALGTQPVGVRITGHPGNVGQFNVIGGVNPGEGNVIAFNGTGVAVVEDVNTDNQILSNSIFNNVGPSPTGLGIDLFKGGAPGFTPNDLGDPDVGPNNLQNFPVLAPVTFSGGVYSVTYSVPSLSSNSTYPLLVEFFRADAAGQEGKELLGRDVYNAPSIPQTFNFGSGVGFALGDRVVATATDKVDVVSGGVSGSTSEFSTSVVAAPCSLVVTTTADFGPGSLREAINCANALPGLNTISFNVGSGPQTINVGPGSLPTVTDRVIIDGTTQPGFNPTTCEPIIELNGTLAGGTANGLTITAGRSVVRGLVINRFPANGITLSILGRNVLAGNYLGTDVTGTVDLGNAVDGVFVDNTRQNVIGGLSVCDRNVISGNDDKGVFIRGRRATLNRVVGNFIGTTASGKLPLGNSRDGIQTFLLAANNTIGGNTTSSRNVISANGGDGVELGSIGNVVRGNFIGTDFKGKGSPGMGNATDGVRIDLARNTILNNVISGNGTNGVEIHATSLAPGNVLRGNFIGTDATGTLNVGNARFGVEINGSPANQIGGPGLGAKNVISGNGLHGVHIIGLLATRNLVQGNYIGTDITGTVALGNTIDGVGIDGAPNNAIGGSASGSGNLISGNLGNGVEIFNTAATGNLVLGNQIGTDVSGMFALPMFRGVFLRNATGNRVGGTGLNDGNLISGNMHQGVFIDGSSTANVLEGNSIGVDVNGGPLGNGDDGVFVLGSNNRIGGVVTTLPGMFTTPNTPDNAANVIAFNGRDGVRVDTGVGNAIRRNSISNNVVLGINLVSGGNTLLAAPVCTGIGLVVTCTAGSGRLEFFLADNLASGEGAVFVTDAVTLSVGMSGLVPSGSILVATLTDALGNTSRFSTPFTV